jgi:hemerythrin-like metal-binding protein
VFACKPRELLLSWATGGCRAASSRIDKWFRRDRRQHRILLERIDEATSAAKADDLARTRQALSSLGDYLVSHFQAEESMMADSAYPERVRHKSAHDLFLQDFAQLGQELEVAGLCPPVLSWVSSRVPEWLKFHIQVNDLPLGRYLMNRRYRPAPAPHPDKPRAC